MGLTAPFELVAFCWAGSSGFWVKSQLAVFGLLLGSSPHLFYCTSPVIVLLIYTDVSSGKFCQAYLLRKEGKTPDRSYDLGHNGAPPNTTVSSVSSMMVPTNVPIIGLESANHTRRKSVYTVLHPLGVHHDHDMALPGASPRSYNVYPGTTTFSTPHHAPPTSHLDSHGSLSAIAASHRPREREDSITVSVQMPVAQPPASRPALSPVTETPERAPSASSSSSQRVSLPSLSTSSTSSSSSSTGTEQPRPRVFFPQPLGSSEVAPLPLAGLSLEVDTPGRSTSTGTLPLISPGAVELIHRPLLPSDTSSSS